MNGEKLMEFLNNIDDDLILEAEEPINKHYRKAKKRSFWINTAYAAAVVVVAVTIGFNLWRSETNYLDDAMPGERLGVGAELWSDTMVAAGAANDLADEFTADYVETEADVFFAEYEEISSDTAMPIERSFEVFEALEVFDAKSAEHWSEVFDRFEAIDIVNIDIIYFSFEDSIPVPFYQIELGHEQENIIVFIPAVDIDFVYVE